ncbi:MAG: TonB-dependent receptor plug domain-containing protein [Salibacteraceae bacterium]
MKQNYPFFPAWLFSFWLVAFPLFGWWQEESKEDSTDAFFDLSLEDMMNVSITSMSKKSEPLKDVAASIYVISQEDIQRSGATRLADLLLMVPGVNMQFNSYDNLSFGMREATDGFVGSVLVLVDGVPYHSPYLSTFSFTNFDLPMEAIDRIEVIKGPGGTIYGANAATGIISIYTKKAKDHQGITVSMNQGSRGFTNTSLYYGTEVGENASLSAFGQLRHFDGFEPLEEFNGDFVTVPKTGGGGDTLIANNLGADVYRRTYASAGLNFEADLAENLKLTSNLHAHNVIGKTYFQPGLNTAINNERNNRVVARVRLDQKFSDDHNLFVHYFTNREANFTNDDGNVITSMGNLEIQDNLKLGFNTFSFGGNVRYVNFRIKTVDPNVLFNDPNASEYLWGVFVQDKLSFGDLVDVTLGVKAETWTLIDNEPELSPSLRVAVKPGDRWRFWGAASRSVTTPGFIQTNLELTVIPNLPPTGLPVKLVTSPSIDQAEYLTGELGIRYIGEKLSFSTSAYYEEADNKVATSQLVERVLISPINNQAFFPIYYANVQKSTNIGVETVVKYRPSKLLTVEVSHAYLSVDKEGKPLPDQPDLIAEVDNVDPPEAPEHTFRLRTYFDFGNGFLLTMNGVFMTESEVGEGFFYDRQAAASFGATEPGIYLDNHRVENRYRVDLKVEKQFKDGKYSAYLWGTDLLNNGTVQLYSQFTTGIPIQTHRIVGGGFTVRL